MNLPVPVYLRPLDQKDASMKVHKVNSQTRLQFLVQSLTPIIVNNVSALSVAQLWCAAGVNLSGGRALNPSEVTKQRKGSQSSLDQLDHDSKVRGRGSG